MVKLDVHPGNRKKWECRNFLLLLILQVYSKRFSNNFTSPKFSAVFGFGLTLFPFFGDEQRLQWFA